MHSHLPFEAIIWSTQAYTRYRTGPRHGAFIVSGCQASETNESSAPTSVEYRAGLLRHCKISSTRVDVADAYVIVMITFAGASAKEYPDFLLQMEESYAQS